MQWVYYGWKPRQSKLINNAFWLHCVSMNRRAFLLRKETYGKKQTLWKMVYKMKCDYRPGDLWRKFIWSLKEKKKRVPLDYRITKEVEMRKPEILAPFIQVPDYEQLRKNEDKWVSGSCLVSKDREIGNICLHSKMVLDLLQRTCQKPD